MNPTGITIQANRRGDPEVHLAGCKHLDKFPGDRGQAWGEPQTHAMTTLHASIVDADTDMADAFCQTVYDPDPPEQPWTVQGITWGPCFSDAVKAAGITFADPRTGRPSVHGQVVLTPDEWAAAERPEPVAVEPVEDATITVTVAVRIEVNVAAYRAEYGHTTRRDIRAAVKAAVLDAARTDGIIVSDVEAILPSVEPVQ